MSASDFSFFVETLRKEQRQSLDGILILYNESITVMQKNVEKTFSFSLERYHLLKYLAHTIVYYSIKHDTQHSKMLDLCSASQDKHRSQETEPYFDHTVPQLMRLASHEYLAALHKVVQEIKSTSFGGVWPAKLLILVCGPASPRFGHPAMQYFARMANCPLEMRRESKQLDGCFSTLGGYYDADISIDYVPKDAALYPGRTLFYVENAHRISEAEHIGLSLYVEQLIFSRFTSMQTDILAPMAAEHLREKCGK